MTPKPSQHYAATADRKAEIALAARALIAEQGFEGLRTRDIAERVGINVATLHYHVPSKAALVCLLAESLRDDFIAQHAGNSRDGLTALERLKLEFAEFAEARETMPELHLVYSELVIRARRDATVADIMRPMLEYWHGEIAGILSDGVADGSFRPNLDPQAGASIVIGALTWRGRNGCAPDCGFQNLTAEILRSLAP